MHKTNKDSDSLAGVAVATVGVLTFGIAFAVSINDYPEKRGACIAREQLSRTECHWLYPREAWPSRHNRN